MKKRQKFSDYYLKGFFIGTSLIFSSILLAWIFLDYFNEYKSNIKILKKNIINERKHLLKNVVNNCFTYIDYNSHRRRGNWFLYPKKIWSCNYRYDN